MTDKVLATVEVASAWASKINWTAAIGGIASLVTIFSGGQLGLDASTQATLVGMIALLQSGVTILLRTKYTTTVTPSSVSSTPPNVLPTIAKMLLVAFALSAFLAGDSAHAATKPPKVDIVQTLSDAFAKLAAKGTAGLESADALASAIDPDTNQMVDAVAHACYPAMIKFVGALPKSSGLADTDVFVIYERARIARLTVQKGLPSYLQIGCAPLVQDEANLLTAILGIAGVAVGTAGLSIPALPGLLPALSILK
jgi:hypothetical protein